MYMRSGKSVLCEKALTINARDAAEMIRVAREENVFLMEAMITRHVALMIKNSGLDKEREDWGSQNGQSFTLCQGCI